MDETHTESTTDLTDESGAPKLSPLKPAFRGLMASHLLQTDKRRALQLVYDYLAALRAVADTPGLEDETRDFLLDEMEDVLLGGTRPVQTAFTQPALRFAHHYAHDEAALQAGQRLLQAARRDIARSTCSSWADLMLYCRYAAEPLGRITLGLYGITAPEAVRAMDALMASLAVMRLMRRAGADWRIHGRCYLPTDWFDEESTSIEHLGEYEMNAGVRKVFDRMLERVQALLDIAAALPTVIKDKRLRGELARLLYIARDEHKQLARYDALEHALVTRVAARWKGWIYGQYSRFRARRWQ